MSNIKVFYSSDSTDIENLSGSVSYINTNSQTQINSLQEQINVLNSNLSSAVPTGTVSAFAGSTAPSGYLLCNGNAISRTTYATLFSAIGTTYGTGNGSTTFNLPDLRGRVIASLDSTQTEFDALGKASGAKTHQLTESEMPSHTHTLSPGQVVGTGSGGVSNYAPTGNNPQNNTVILSTGGNQAHNNLQPYMVLNYIIKH